MMLAVVGADDGKVPVSVLFGQSVEGFPSGQREQTVNLLALPS